MLFSSWSIPSKPGRPCLQQWVSDSATSRATVLRSAKPASGRRFSLALFLGRGESNFMATGIRGMNSKNGAMDSPPRRPAVESEYEGKRGKASSGEVPFA